MKNRILGMASIICLAVLTTFNVNLTSIENDSFDLASVMNISTANAEIDWTNVLQGQGLTKDEKVVQEACYSYTNWYGGISYGNKAKAGAGATSLGANGRTDIRCTYGSVNCTSIDC